MVNYSIISVVAERIEALIKEKPGFHVDRGGSADEAEVRSLARELKSVRFVNYFSLSMLEQTCYEVEDVLDEWKYAILKHQSDDAVVAPMKKVCSFPSSSCLCFKKAALPRGIAKKIIDVNAKLKEVLRGRKRCSFVKSQLSFSSRISWLMPTTNSASDSEVVHGRDFYRDILVAKLLGRQEKTGIPVVSIVGDLGLEKTLAELVYNDSRVEKCFDLRIWIFVSDSFDLANIVKGILESVRKGSSSYTARLDVLLQDVKEVILGKRFLLVLDGFVERVFWNWGILESRLIYCEAGSNILITRKTQNITEADEMADFYHHMEKLTDEECLLLLSDEAFKDIGEEIAKECRGSPHVAHFLGRLLHSKSSVEDWEKVLHCGISQLVEAEKCLFSDFSRFYSDEHYPMLKHCFSYCAIFPKGSEIVVEELIGNWMALGYLGSNTNEIEQRGHQCFQSLASSLLQDLERDGLNDEIKSCKMPDIVHDFVMYLRKIGRINDGRLNTTTCGACDPFVISTETEFFSLLFGYFDDSRRNLCDCLKRLRVLSVPKKNRLQGFPRGLENLIHLRWLKLDGNHLSGEGLKTIFQLCNLQTLLLRHCKLEEIPSEIGNLIQLRRLDLSDNPDLKELPKTMGRLRELRNFNVRNCPRLIRLPREMQWLQHLKYEFSFRVDSLCSLGLFKKLYIRSGTLRLRIRLSDDYSKDVVMSAVEAELREKRNVQELVIEFEDEMKKGEDSSQRRLDLMNALEPHPNLQSLEIWSYNGPDLPAWILFPGLHNLRNIRISNCNYISSLPALAELDRLVEIEMFSMYGLQSVGREFLGITIDGGVAFPELQKLTFRRCPNWNKWEDITVQEEESHFVVLMPRLTHLTLKLCTGLTELPHRLLRKVPSLKVLDLSYSEKLQQRYGDKDTSAGMSIFRNPHLQIKWTS